MLEEKVRNVLSSNGFSLRGGAMRLAVGHLRGIADKDAALAALLRVLLSTSRAL